MGVYIRGIEMPTSCGDCKLRMAIGCCGNLPHNTRMPNCPLVEIPPHGDLIDKDAYEYPGDLIDEPVIIPAEEGE